MRKPLAIAVLACVVLPMSTWAAEETSKTTKVEEMFQLTNSEQMMRQSLEQIRTMQQSQIAQLDLPAGAKAHQQEIMERINGVLTERLSWEKLKPHFVQLMADTFTDQELDGILAFYRSPAGKAMMEKMPQYMTKTMGIVQELMVGIQPEIKRIVDEAKEKK